MELQINNKRNFRHDFDIFSDNLTEEIFFVEAKGASYTNKNAKKYIVLSEISVVLGQKHANFNKQIAEALESMTAENGTNRPFKDELY